MMQCKFTWLDFPSLDLRMIVLPIILPIERSTPSQQPQESPRMKIATWWKIICSRNSCFPEVPWALLGRVRASLHKCTRTYTYNVCYVCPVFTNWDLNLIKMRYPPLFVSEIPSGTQSWRDFLRSLFQLARKDIQGWSTMMSQGQSSKLYLLCRPAGIRSTIFVNLHDIQEIG